MRFSKENGKIEIHITILRDETKRSVGNGEVDE